MENVEIAWMLQEIADLLELAQDNHYKALAYRKAAREISRNATQLTELNRSQLEAIPGVGEHLAMVLEEIVATGESTVLRDLKGQVPPGLVQVLALPGVGPKVARMLHKKLGITNLAELEAAAKARRIRKLPGMGPKTEMGILRGIDLMRQGATLVPIGIATQVAHLLVEALQALPQVDQVSVVGSLRRGKELVGDVDLLVATVEPEKVGGVMVRHPVVQEVLNQSEQHLELRLFGGIKAEVFMTGPQDFSFYEFLLTGSQEHVAQLQTVAQDQGISMTPAGVVGQMGDAVSIGSESDLYAALKLPYIAPELREGEGEVEAARTGALPELLQLTDVKGDLHLHSNWSDGVSSIEQIVAAAKARNYEYVAITDHSKSLVIAGGLTEEQLDKQHRLVRELNEKNTDIQVLTGVEVDILNDGVMDYPDEVLQEADIVVGSIHSGFKQSGEQLTERALMAIKNPHVDILAHPTGRMLGRRDPYAIDMQQVFEAAAKYQTILEINASPDRLDLKAEHVRQAKEYGIKIAINTDAHDIARLQDMEFGVINGRRGWLTSEDVVNTWDYDRLNQWLEHRR